MTKEDEITEVPGQPGTYYIDGQTWQVGERYKLKKKLGSGSFSSVCLAYDTVLQDQVALKRIPDVLNSLENAKRVLREVCILRRLDHPNIVALRDVMLRPSATGRFVYRKGKLVPTSLDLYISTEFCALGDLFHMKGQLSEIEVKHIMWQLLWSIKYLHDMGVWHRDIKSANVLMTLSGGARMVKLADLGSARSALTEGNPRALSDGGVLESRVRDLATNGLRHCSSFVAESAPSARDLVARPRPGGGAGFTSPLTRMVCTPCYRAPEVVMSRGGYTAAIDMWSCGCIFGELLQRVSYIGKASTPQLQVAPVFAIQGLLDSPATGDTYGQGPAHDAIRRELHALFAVIGTPAWSCIDAVQSHAWRNYLKRIPGRAPTLYRRFGAAGEAAVDLLARLLTFDPARRCSAEEALAHEYFKPLHEAMRAEPLPSLVEGEEAGVSPSVRAARAPSSAEADAADEEMRAADEQLRAITEEAGEVDEEELAEWEAADEAEGGDALGSQPGVLNSPVRLARAHTLKRTRSSTGAAGVGHYYELTNAAAALSALEKEMDGILHGTGSEGGAGVNSAAADLLRGLLEREVTEHSAGVAEAAATRDAASAKERAAPSMPPPTTTTTRAAAAAAAAAGIARNWEHARADTGFEEDPSKIAEQRMPFHADAQLTALDSAVHLRAGRHGEWTKETLPPSSTRAGGHGRGARDGGTWGVSLLPPGMTEQDHPELAAVIRAQHKR